MFATGSKGKPSLWCRALKKRGGAGDYICWNKRVILCLLICLLVRIYVNRQELFQVFGNARMFHIVLAIYFLDCEIKSVVLVLKERYLRAYPILFPHRWIQELPRLF